MNEKNEKTNGENGKRNAGRPRKYLSQAEVPGYSLEQSLRIPLAIAEHYALGSVTPIQLAAALDMRPTSGSFRGLTGAALAYEITNGGYNAKSIEVTPLGRRCVKPQEEGDDRIACREALLKPRVLGEFLRKYDGSSLPRPDIAVNVLEAMGVPPEKCASVFETIVEGAKSQGFIQEIKGKDYVQLQGIITTAVDDSPIEIPETPVELTQSASEEVTPVPNTPPSSTEKHESPESSRKVFVTHGKNKEFVEPIKKLLGFGEMIPVISVERESVSKPVPDKVLDDMRTCGAAIIHVADETRLFDRETNEHVIINANVLIEIGAAMALYGRRFILLVKEGIQLPSNLQGLYEVRYRGDALDGDATIKLLEAINDIKNHQIPNTTPAQIMSVSAIA